MKNRYPISSYNYYLCLKVNSTMMLIFLFLLRPYVVLLLSVVNRRDKMGLINMVYSDRISMSLSAFAAIPAAVLVYAWIKRTPDAKPLIRRAWGNGRSLLTASTLLNACIVFVPLLLGTAHKIPSIAWAQLAVSLLILFTLYKSPYIKDCFADFPEPGKKD